MATRPPSSSFRHLYLAAAAVGLALTGALCALAWQSSLRAETARFENETGILREEPYRQLSRAVALVDATAHLLEATGAADADVLGDWLDREAVDRPGGSVVGVLMTEPASGELALVGAMPAAAEAFAGLVGTPLPKAWQPSDGRAGAIVPRYDHTRHLLYLLRPVALAGSPELLVVLALAPDGLTASASAFPDHEVRLFLETQDERGRQQLSVRNPAPLAFEFLRLSDTRSLTFPAFSVRMVSSRAVGPGALDGGLFATALLLGAGVTLLLVALARARDLSLRALAERTRVVEEQVERQTRELAEARDLAVQASAVKSDFLASMSHEIRTPLNAIVGMAELLDGTALDSDQARYVDVFREAGEALLTLVNDILDFSKIEAGELTLEHIPFRPHGLVHSALELYRFRARDAGIALDAELPDGLPEALMGDPGRIRQILLNLLGNALKFTERGSVQVRVAAVDGAWEFAVEDSGIGIAPDKLGAIFDSFTQGDTSTTRRFGGTGLGLTISRRLAELMGGTIGVESTLGEGSRFWFRLPLREATEAERAMLEDASGPRQVALPPRSRGASAAPVPVSGGAGEQAQAPARTGTSATPRVLLVEDNPDNRMLVEAYLADYPCQLLSAVNGAEAVAAFQAGGIDLVLMDVQMPVMDGHTATREIRAFEAAQGLTPTPVLALSANAVAEDIEASHAAGCTDHLTKPIRRKTLLAALDSQLAARGDGG